MTTPEERFSMSQGIENLRRELKELLEQADIRFNGLRKADDDRYAALRTADEKAVSAAMAAASKAVDAALAAASKAVDAAMAAANKAADLQETNTKAWKESQNEWRGAMNDRENKFMRIEDKAAIERDIKTLTTRLDLIQGSGAGLKAGWGYLVGGVGVLVLIWEIIISKFTK